MRRTLVPLLAVVAACATPPPPAPLKVEPPPAPTAVEADPLEFSSFVVKQQTLLGLTLQLDGKLGRTGGPRALAWKAAVGESALGSGTWELAPGPDGAFTQELKLELGADAAALAPYQSMDRFQLLLETTLGEGEGAVTRTRAVTVWSPKLPRAEVKSVQASRSGPSELALTYLFNIANPNPFEVRVGLLSYRASIDGRFVGRGELPLSAKVPASGENLFEIPAEANVETFGKDIGLMLKKPEVPWAFVGSLKVGGVEVPVDLKGTVKSSQ